MFTHFKKFVAAVFFITLILGFVAFNPIQSTKSSSKNTLVVGLQSGYPPFEFIDSEGKIVGFDVDLAKTISEKLGKSLIINDMEFDGEILSLKQGKIDLIISGMNITPSRLKEIDMIPYHGEASSSLSLIFWNEIPQGIQTLEDITKFPNYFVSVESGAIPEMYISKYESIHAKSFQGAFAPLMDVKYGKSIANLVESDVAEYLQMQHPEIKIVKVPLSKEEQILGFGIGIKKENNKLFQEIQKTIQELKSSGELKKIEDKWFKGVKDA